jgi:very-short-patch-repair endonuclease
MGYYQNRPKPTPQAERLGELLKKYGYNVEFEKYDGFKHIDIAIVNKKVNIEVDGGHHHGKTQALRDLKRTFYSWNKDFVTLRIPNSLTEDDATLKETAEYIDKFLRKDRTQLDKEIREEYEVEGKDSSFWRDANNDFNNLVNGVNKIINNMSSAVNNANKTFNNAFKSFKL